MVRGKKIVAAFDMDGTSINTEGLNRDAAQDAAGGRQIDWLTWAGKPEEEVHAWLKAQDPTFTLGVADFIAQCKKGREARWNDIRAREGMSTVYQMFRDIGATIVVVTGTDHDTAVSKLRHTGLIENFHTVGTIIDGVLGKDDMIARGLGPKPAPDGYIHVAREFGADHLIIFEDITVGINSAVAAQAALAGVDVTIAHFYGLDGKPDPRADFHISDDPKDLIGRTRTLLGEISALQAGGNSIHSGYKKRSRNLAYLPS